MGKLIRQTITTNLSGLKVLLIDDDRLQQDIIRRIYTHNGVECDCCYNLQDFVELLRKNNYDLVLTDMRMPETDGYGVLTLLRRCNLGKSKNIPVLVVTARMDQPIDSFINVGFAGCLYKPFSEEELISMTAKCIKVPVSSFHRDLVNLMDGENDRKELLDIFIEDSTDRIIILREALATDNFRNISEIVHKCAPLLEALHIGVPIEVLEKLASLPADKWDEVSLCAAERFIETMEQVVQAARKLREDLP